jgi:uncharacterized small protein (DUF1192 family)
MAFWDQMEKFINDSINISKQAFEKAKELGSLTKKEVELKSLQGKAQKALAELGGVVYRVLGEEQKKSLAGNDGQIKDVMTRIGELEARITEKRAEIETLRQQMSDDKKQRDAEDD